jgi:hypothetical protein
MRSTTLAAAAAFAALLAGHASAATLLSDDFNADLQGLNSPGDAVFTSTSAPGSVDIIGTGFFDLQPGNGNYVDLDGSSGDGHATAGELTSVATFGPGSYTLTFDLAGNLRGAAAQTTTVSLGSFSQAFSPDANAAFSLQTVHFHTTTGGALIFTEAGPSDQQGNLLDNVILSSDAVVVPEPASWALMLIGFGGAGALLRTRRRRAACRA